MEITSQKKASPLLIVIAFATVYVVWGSTYFFIRMAIHGFPPLLMGAVRYLIAGILLLVWCWIKGDRLWVIKDIKASAISGLLMLFIATGVVIWVERTIPSAMVAIVVSANPVWFVVLDKVNWRINLKNKTTIAGLTVGFAGVVLLFGEAIGKSFTSAGAHVQLSGLLLLLVSPIAWCAGSLYSKNRSGNTPARLNTAWQMLIAGMAFIPAALIHHEFNSFDIAAVPAQAWLAISYLIVFGSIGAFSAYVWLLQVRPAIQVSSHSYVNPVIAVLLGVFFAHESISALQLFGLLVILVSVLLVNLTKYSFKKRLLKQQGTAEMPINYLEKITPLGHGAGANNKLNLIKYQYEIANEHQ
jgi:drug/metabolite transporter (DMT)-like permease